MDLSKYLKKGDILFKNKTTNRWDIIAELVDLVIKNKHIPLEHSAAIKKGLIERERSMSTGIGRGVAIPHYITDLVHDCVMALAVIREGVDFEAIDGNPVRIVIMLLVPKNKLSQHVKTLARIAKLMSNEEVRNHIIESNSQDAVINIISEHSRNIK